MSHHLPRATLAVAVALATAGACAAPALAAPAPHRGHTVIVTRVSGHVRIRQPHGRVVTVRRPDALRSGGTLLTAGGVAAVTVATRHGERTARVSRGESRVTQTASGETTFTLPALRCSANVIGDARRPPGDTLWVHDHHGPFISRGGYASGAARGTTWTTSDACDSTTIRVRAGKVLVTDFVRHRHVLISAGHSYTARAASGGGGSATPLSWTAPQPIGNGGTLTSVSCPTTTFCAAVDSNADVLTTTDPAGGPSTWTTTLVGTSSLGFDAISCPSTTLCVVSEELTGDVWVSTDPTGGAGTWTATNLIGGDGALSGLTCPTTTLCVGVSGGDVWTSTDPTSGNWADATVYPGGNFDTVTCASTGGLCLAIGPGLSTSTNPAGGAGAWRTTTSLGAGSGTCPTTSLCLLGDGTNDIFVSTNPSGGPSTYNEQQLVDKHSVFATITGIDCPGTSDCLAVDDAGDVLSTGDPTAGPWTTTQADPSGGLDAISCPSATLCVAVDGSGNEIVGTAASGSAGGADALSRGPRSPATVAASVRTRVVVMAGFTVGGRPTMRITRTLRGSCFSTSDAALRDDAYRCTSGNELFDPCLAPPAAVHAGHVVVCPTDPFRDTAIEIRLTRRLPHNAGPAPSERGLPFAIRLTNGCEAMLDTGATAVIGRERANYYCARTRQALWGAPSRRGRLWTIWSAPPQAKHLSRRVTIAEAWF